MFKKKPTIKPLAPLRSSDRRKIADQIIRDYKVAVPSPAATKQDGEESSSTQATAPSLSSIRNSLVPENTLAGRFRTTAGPDLHLVQGTIYVGTHPGGEERVLWTKLEQGPGTDARIYPTVYSLWHNPGLTPLIHTPEFVMEKLYGGADLMVPGLANGPPFPEGAVKGAVVAVASLDKPSVPTFVGVCEIDVSSLGRVQGEKGHAVKGVQWEGDEVWRWSTTGQSGQPSPEEINGWIRSSDTIETHIGGLNLEDNNEEIAVEGEGGGGVFLDETLEQGADGDEDDQIPPPTTKEIDTAFLKSFLYSIYQHKVDNPNQTNHGIAFPIQPSSLMSNHITPFLPVYSSQQAQYYQIKKTSWKNLKKFIKYLDKQRLVKSKDRNGGETVIMDVDFTDAQISGFVPYRLPRKSDSENTKKSGKDIANANDGKQSLGQTLNVKTLYRPTGKLVPELFPSLSSTDVNNYYSPSDVLQRLNDYLSSQDPPIISPSNPRNISLNPFISNKIIPASDVAILARGTIQRDALLRKILENPSLCAPFHALLKPNQSLSDVKPKAGALPKVTITIERRTGSKLVTKVTGLEKFGVSPQLLADELSKKCASSTSVNQAPGAVKGIMEVLLQGDHRRVVEYLMINRGVKSQWLDVVDKSQKKKGGASGGGGGSARS